MTCFNHQEQSRNCVMESGASQCVDLQSLSISMAFRILEHLSGSVMFSSFRWDSLSPAKSSKLWKPCMDRTELSSWNTRVCWKLGRFCVFCLFLSARMIVLYGEWIFGAVSIRKVSWVPASLSQLHATHQLNLKPTTKCPAFVSQSQSYLCF